VALTHNDGTHAVMMTTPQDLEDLAVGFSLSEEIISSTVKLDSLEVLRLCDGIERRMWLSGPKADRLKGAMAAYCGPTGCGLCGIESVAEASRPVALVGAAASRLPPQRIRSVHASLPDSVWSDCRRFGQVGV
jgi:FdhD protein